MELRGQIRELCQTAFDEALDQLILLAKPEKVTSLQARLALSRTVNDIAQEYHTTMTVEWSKAPYNKAFCRITGRQVCGYDLIVYRDKQQLKQLFEKYMEDVPIADFDLETKATERRVWIFFDKLSEAAQGFAGYAHPPPPTYEAIEAEIERHRQGRKQKKKQSDGAIPQTMEEAQHQSLVHGIQQLQQQCGVPVQIPPEQDLFVHLKTQLSMTAESGDAYSKLASSGDTANFASADLWKEWKLPPFTTANEAAWQEFMTCCHRANMLADLQRALPPNMLKHIESHAAGLATQLDDGSMDLASVDMAQMGQSVIGSCTETDMTHLSQNIGTLLPTLNTLAQSMNSVPGVPPVSTACDAMNAAAGDFKSD